MGNGTSRTCTVCGAGGKLIRGMCGKHYRSWLDRTPHPALGTPARPPLQPAVLGFRA